MPIAGLEINGKNLSFKDAFIYSIKHKHMSRAYFKYMYQDSKNPHKFPSVTVLNNCPRANWIFKNHDLYITPESNYALFFGTITHAILENLDLGESALKEFNMKIQIGKHSISGTCDLYNKKTQQLIDYKTTKKINFSQLADGKTIPLYLQSDTYKRQLHIYALGLEQNGYPVKSMAIEYFPKEKGSIKCNGSCFSTDALPYRVLIDYDKKFQAKIVKQYTKVLDSLLGDNPCPSWESCFGKQPHAWKCYKVDADDNIISSYCSSAKVCKKLHDREKMEMKVMG